jgi:hypothetical protein
MVTARGRADPDIAVAVGERCVEQRDVGLERRQQHDRVVVAERIVDHLPVRPVRQHVRADQAAQRHERNALLGRLERRVQGGAGGVLDSDRARGDRRREARRRPEFPGLTAEVSSAYAAGADQQVGLQARTGSAMRVSATRRAGSAPRRRHGGADTSRGTASAAVGDRGQSFVEGAGDHG